MHFLLFSHILKSKYQYYDDVYLLKQLKFNCTYYHEREKCVF